MLSGMTGGVPPDFEDKAPSWEVGGASQHRGRVHLVSLLLRRALELELHELNRIK